MNQEKRQEILNMVRQQLQRESPPSTEALYGRAVRIDESLRNLSLRQFNARYPLQVRREMAEIQKEENQATLDRPALRQVFCELAVEVVDAESDAQLIELVTEGLDAYVDRVMAVLPEV